MKKRQQQTRRAFLGGLGMAAGAMAFPGAPAGAGDKQRPNMVVVLCDDLGYGDLGCYGHSRIKTPNLDRFAREGVKLTDCYAAAPVCSPARAGMLTGRTPYRSGIYDWIPPDRAMHLQRKEKTVATLLQSAGYATCHVGKWHCNGKFNSPEQPQPGDHGFDYWFSTQNNALLNHRNPKNFVRNGVAVGPMEGYSSELIVSEAVHWLKDEWDRSKPFCLFVWFHSPHEVVATAPEFVEMYEGVDKLEQREYFGNVTQIDHEFGRLMATLGEMDVRDNSFVMFTSDNGPETLNRYRSANRSYGSPGPLRGMKLHLYEGGIRVPGMIQWPGHSRPGMVSNEPVCGTDVLPTLCALAGVAAPADRAIDGANFLPLLDGKTVSRSVPLYWRYDRAISPPYTVAIRDGDWKLLADTKLTQFALYNLREDPSEQNDLAERAPERLEALRRKLIPLHEEIDAEGPVWPQEPKKKKRKKR